MRKRKLTARQLEALRYVREENKKGLVVEGARLDALYGNGTFLRLFDKNLIRGGKVTGDGYECCKTGFFLADI